MHLYAYIKNIYIYNWLQIGRETESPDSRKHENKHVWESRSTIHNSQRYWPEQKITWGNARSIVRRWSRTIAIASPDEEDRHVEIEINPENVDEENVKIVYKEERVGKMFMFALFGGNFGFNGNDEIVL